MSDQRETPEHKRERLRQEELKRNSTGALKDGVNRAQNDQLPDLFGGLGWKETGIVMVVLIVGYSLYKLIF